MLSRRGLLLKPHTVLHNQPKEYSMPRALFVDFKAVKAAVTMEQVLDRYALLDQFKRSGDSLSGPCPIHKGSNPTQFRVSVSKNVWHCFSECKHGGNVLDFISRMENVSIHAAALKAIEWFNLNSEAISADSGEEDSGQAERSETRARPVDTKPAEPENTTPNKPLKFRLEKLERQHPYLIERGLLLETVIDFGVGYCSKGMMAGRIAIPIHTLDGEVVAYAGRWPGEPPEGTPKYKLPQGFRKSLELYNIDRAVKEPQEMPLVIVEGFFGCMALHQHGHRKVVGLIGSSMSQAQEETIRRHTNRDSRVIVMLDEDEAGRIGREEVATRLSKFVFVKIHVFKENNQQPEHLTADEIAMIIG
jgi:DNA primase